MKNRSEPAEVCMCALDGVMDLLGKKWVLFTINSIGGHGTIRFSELYQELHERVTFDTLFDSRKGWESLG